MTESLDLSRARTSLERLYRWMNGPPIPTEGATFQMTRLREAIDDIFAARAEPPPSYDGSKSLGERLREMVRTDHLRGCAGRNYECTCGHIDRQDALMLEAASRLSDGGGEP